MLSLPGVGDTHRPDRPLVPLLLPAWILGTAGRTCAAGISPVPVID